MEGREKDAGSIEFVDPNHRGVIMEEVAFDGRFSNEVSENSDFEYWEIWNVGISRKLAAALKGKRGRDPFQSRDHFPCLPSLPLSNRAFPVFPQRYD